MADKSVEILPESDDVLACVKYTGVIKKDDYKPFFDRLEDNMNKTGRVRVLAVFDENFQGWEMDAAESNFRSVLEYAPDAERIAYVNPPESKIFQMKLSAPMLKGKLKFFNKDSFDQAYEWVKSEDD